jgi:hypothetical protein
MTRRARALSLRNSSGFVSVKHLILVALVFGVYTGWKFVSVSFTKGQLEHTVQTVLDGTNHLATDITIRKKIVNAATSGSFPLEESQIEVQREKLPGSRIIHVSVDYPVAISYLGSERTVDASVHVSKAIQVDEAAEARREAAERRQAEAGRRAAERERRFRADVKDAFAECTAKHGPSGCELTYGYAPGAQPGQLIRDY